MFFPFVCPMGRCCFHPKSEAKEKRTIGRRRKERPRAHAEAQGTCAASAKQLYRLPMWPDSLRSKVLHPTARRVGITKQIGWHTFGHTYSSLLAQTGNDVRVAQELMRHAKASTTLEVYTHAGMDEKRLAQRKAVDVLFDRSSGTETVGVAKVNCSQTVPA
jgi:integrase